MVNDKLEMAGREHGKARSLTSQKRTETSLPALPGGPRQKDALGGCCQLLRIFIQQEISQLQLQLLLKLTKALKNKQTAIEQFQGRDRGSGAGGEQTLLEGCCRISACNVQHCLSAAAC